MIRILRHSLASKACKRDNFLAGLRPKIAPPLSVKNCPLLALTRHRMVADITIEGAD